MIGGGLDRLGSSLLQNRRFVRAPLWLYQHGIGWLLGERILMLEHQGRVSGLPRYVCLEVVDRPSAQALVVVSGFGERSQWYRNLRQHPECFVSVGRRRRVPARAEFLSEQEARAALERYQVAHPRAWSRLRGAIEHAVGHPVDGLPMVRLALTSG